MSILNKIFRFLRNEEGPTTVEYAVMLMLILGVVIATVQALGLSTQTSFEQSSDEIIKAVGS